MFLLQMHVLCSVDGDTSCKVAGYLEMYSVHCYTISWGGYGRLMVTEVVLPSAVQFSVMSELHRHQAYFHTHFLCSKSDKNLTRRPKLCFVPHGEWGRPEATVSYTLLFPYQAEADEEAVVDARLLYPPSLLNGTKAIWCSMALWKHIFCVQ